MLEPQISCTPSNLAGRPVISKAPIHWLNTTVLSLTPLLAITLIPWYGFTTGFDLFEWSVFFCFLMLTGVSITAGYHRLWSHRTYDAHISVRIWLALWGAASLQNSILHWSADHRNHHRFTDDNDRDPYSSRLGFWFSHIGWILRRNPSGRHDFSMCKDLLRDPVVIWQDKYYIPLAVIMNLGLPLAIGYLHGKLWGVLLLAGLLRIVLNHHFTFFINSLAHMWGKMPYAESSAKDNGLLALFTYGEGYHNFHHAFPTDYRNGIRWWQYDPSKWMINTLALMGLTKRIKTIPWEKIEKARLEVQYQNAIRRLANAPQDSPFHKAVQGAYEKMNTSIQDWSKAKRAWQEARKLQLHHQQQEMRMRYLELRMNLKEQRRQWRQLTSQLASRLQPLQA